MKLSERSLARALKRGDREACGELITAYSGKLYRLFFQLTGRTQVAEDLVQETYLKVWRSLRDFRAQSSLSTWIYRIAMSAFHDYLRHKKRNPAFGAASLDLDGLKSSDRQPMHEASLNDELGRLADAVGGLPLELKVPLVLRYYHNLSVRRVAAASGLTYGQTKYCLKKALERLRRSLEV